jgi:hypothetical protein
MVTIEAIACLHILMLIFSSYNYIVSKFNSQTYIHLHRLFTNIEILQEFVQMLLKIIFIEEICYRVYLNEIIEYILDYFVENHNCTYCVSFISSMCFAFSHIVNYYLVKKHTLQNIRMTIAQVIYTFILSYYYLQNTTPLGSLILHIYSNTFCLILQYCFHNY